MFSSLLPLLAYLVTRIHMLPIIIEPHSCTIAGVYMPLPTFQHKVGFSSLPRSLPSILLPISVNVNVIHTPIASVDCKVSSRLYRLQDFWRVMQANLCSCRNSTIYLCVLYEVHAVCTANTWLKFHTRVQSTIKTGSLLWCVILMVCIFPSQ